MTDGLVAPTEDRWRALARSSPWLWRTARFTVAFEGTGDAEQVRAWLDRRHALRVEPDRGDPVVQLLERRTVGWFSYDGAGRTSRGTRAEPFPWEIPVEVERDGMVSARPPECAVAEELMWRDYRWVAMLDPVELADGSGQRPGSATVLSDLHAGDRHGRLTWWAVVREGPGYDPRCTCCALLDGPLADCLDTDEGGSRARGAPPPDDLPTRWSIGLDRATGIVVSLQPLDGTSLAGGFEVRLHGVDEDLDPGLFR